MGPLAGPATATATAAVTADYFDGRQARPRRVIVTVAAGRLRLIGDEVDLDLPLSGVRWPERQRHGAGVVQLDGGGTLQPVAGESWRMLGAGAPRDSLVVRAQQSWRGVAAALVALIVVLVAGWLWGIPSAARGLVALLPADVDRMIGNQMATTLDHQLFGPSRLSPGEQLRLRETVAEAVNRAWPAGDAPRYDLRFVDGKGIGPNALALPGGTIFVTDQLVALTRGEAASKPKAAARGNPTGSGDAGQPSSPSASRSSSSASPAPSPAGRAPASIDPEADAMLVGVMAHELGHVERRHGMRSAAQALLVGLVAAVALGDVSTIIAGVPVVLVQQGYARGFEREADADSVRLLRAAGYSPAAMATFFERLNGDPGKGGNSGGDGSRESGRSGGSGSGGDDQGRADDNAARDSEGRDAVAIGLGSHPSTQERIDYFRRAASGHEGSGER